MRPQHPQAPLTEEQRNLASSYEIARQQNAKNLDKAVLMIELRKWSVEQAMECGPPIDEALPLARGIFAFISEPLE
jgi:hypothetical protein